MVCAEFEAGFTWLKAVEAVRAGSAEADGLPSPAFTQTGLDATCRVHRIGRLIVTGQHTDCCCRHTSYDASAGGITVVAVADATAVYQPFAAGRYQQSQDGAPHYLRTYYGAEVTDTAALL